MTIYSLLNSRKLSAETGRRIGLILDAPGDDLYKVIGIIDVMTPEERAEFAMTLDEPGRAIWEYMYKGFQS